jgi:hypothetical protein
LVSELAETWTWRELPLLRIAVREVDQGRNVAFQAMADEAGIDIEQVSVAMKALRDEGFVQGWFSAGDGGFVKSVSGEARRTVGTWPKPENVVAQIAAALELAAEQAEEPERKGRLKGAAEALAGAARDIAVEVVAKQIGG